MTFILDTNAVSALMKGDAATVARLAETNPADVWVPQPVLAEIAYGIERLPRSKRRTRLQGHLRPRVSSQEPDRWRGDETVRRQL